MLVEQRCRESSEKCHWSDPCQISNLDERYFSKRRSLALRSSFWPTGVRHFPQDCTVYGVGRLEGALAGGLRSWVAGILMGHILGGVY